MRVSFGASLVLSTALLLPAAGPGPSGSPVVVTDLRCEYRSNPAEIDEKRPRLGWVLTSSQRNQVQSAYQVLVATSEAALANDRGDLWNSGKVVSSRSVHVVYDGKPLASRTICYWKTRVWDGEGRVSP
jgi:alpha-L-rhamnosidase